MIAFLRGRLLDKAPNRLIVDVGGVGYDLHVPISTFTATGEVGDEVALRVHTHVRDDQIALFGFRTVFELQCFEQLIAVSGIGPKLALAVLSGIEPADLIRSVQRGDLARLTAIPGIGKKTAERITLELRDRLPALPERDAAATRPSTTEAALRDDLVSALLNLGYGRPHVEKVLDRVIPGLPAAGFEPALRAALRELAK